MFQVISEVVGYDNTHEIFKNVFKMHQRTYLQQHEKFEYFASEEMAQDQVDLSEEEEELKASISTVSPLASSPSSIDSPSSFGYVSQQSPTPFLRERFTGSWAEEMERVEAGQSRFRH